jgi:hypothetical protein
MAEPAASRGLPVSTRSLSLTGILTPHCNNVIDTIIKGGRESPQCAFR